MRRANPDDVPLLLHLMTEFYAEAGYKLNQTRAAQAFSDVIADERLGWIWIITAGTDDVGHVVVTARYGMEYAGLIASLDDLYVRPSWRNRGLSTAALREIRSFCERAGLRALTVEVGITNAPAQAVYGRVGFTASSNRKLLALALAAPAHDV